MSADIATLRAEAVRRLDAARAHGVAATLEARDARRGAIGDAIYTVSICVVTKERDAALHALALLLAAMTEST